MATGDDGPDQPRPGWSGPARPPVETEPTAPRLNGRTPDLDNNPAGSPEPEEPIWVRHRPPFYYQPRVVLALLVILLFVGAVALSQHRSQWPPTAQCDHPAIAASTSHLSAGYPLYWAITGPNQRYAVTYGASAVTMSGGRLTITATESMAGGKALVLRQPTMLTGCKSVAHFDNPLPVGEYHLRLYQVTGDSAKLVGSTRVDSDG